MRLLKFVGGLLDWLFGWNTLYIAVVLLVTTFTALLLVVDWALGKRPRT